MPRKKGIKTKPDPIRKGPRKPISSDFGNYIRTLRRNNAVTVKTVAQGLALSESTIANVEKGINPPPHPERLKIWLKLIGEPGRYQEALRFIRSLKNSRMFHYPPRSPANEHVDRVLDALESNRLTETDIELLRMVAPEEYSLQPLRKD